MHPMKNLCFLLAALPGATNAFAPHPHLSHRVGTLSSQSQYYPAASQPLPPLHQHDCNSRLNRKSRCNIIQLNASLSPAVHTALVSSSVAILAGYHIRLFQKEMNNDYKSWRQYQADTREDWARHVRETEGWLYAIQSLRNAMTAQSFLASTVLSLLTLITGKMWDILRTSTQTWERRLLTAQLASISTTMLLSSYQFLQGVRLMTHAGFMFPVNGDNTKVDNIMRRTQNCQWLGLRWMYLSLAPISWVVGGPRAFFVVACLLLQFFRSIDKKPEGLGYEDFQGLNI